MARKPTSTQFKKPKTKKRNLKKTTSDDDTAIDPTIDESKTPITATTTTTEPNTPKPTGDATTTTIEDEVPAVQPSIAPTDPGPSDDNDDSGDGASSGGSTTLSKIRSIQMNRRLKSFQRRVITDHSNDTNRRKTRNDNRANRSGGGGGSDDDDAKKQALAREANKDLKERLEGTFATNKRAGGGGGKGGDDDDDDDDIEDGDRGVLQRKHKLAMEQYIQSQMDGEVVGGKNADDLNGSSSRSNSVVIQDQSALYAQLIREATMATTEGGAATIGQNNASDTATTGAESNNNANSGGDTQEGDVGAGGAMLGGTGIAEVVLPVEERIQTAKNTELAASQLNRRWAASRQMAGGSGGEQDGAAFADSRSGGGGKDYLRDCLPTNFGQGPGKKRQPPSLSSSTSQVDIEPPSNRPRTTLNTEIHVPQTTTISHHGSGAKTDSDDKQLPSHYSASSAGNNVRSEDVSHIGASFSHNYRLHTNEWISNKKREQQVEIDAINKEKEVQEGTGLNRMRVGFEVKRGLQTNGGRGNRATTGTHNEGAQSQGGSRGGRGGGGGRGRARDNQTWKNFIYKERDRGLKR